jgi:hypothetical protein
LVVTDEALAGRVTEQHAAFGRAEVVRAVAVAATQGATLAEIDARVDAFFASGQAVSLVEGRWWTTPEILRLEGQTIDSAWRGVGVGAGLADPVAVKTAIAARPSLAAEQQTMVRRVTTSGNRLDVVVSPPGCGKTFALDAVRAAYQAGGHRVIGVTLAARAARELEAGAGIESRTAKGLQLALHNGRETLDARTVVVITKRPCWVPASSPTSSPRRTGPKRRSSPSATPSSYRRSKRAGCSPPCSAASTLSRWRATAASGTPRSVPRSPICGPGGSTPPSAGWNATAT